MLQVPHAVLSLVGFSKAVLQICFSTAHSQLLSADTPLLTPLVIFLRYSDISWYFKYFLCSTGFFVFFFFYSIEFLSFSFQEFSGVILFTIAAGLPAVKGDFSPRCSTIAAYSRYERRLCWSM